MKRPARTKNRNSRNKPSDYVDRLNMDQPGLRETAFYLHHQVPRVVVQDTVVVIRTKTANLKEFMKVEATPMDRQANEAGTQTRSRMLIHGMNLTFPASHKAYVMMTPKWKLPTMDTVWIFPKAI
jgi:hypothetical protein